MPKELTLEDVKQYLAAQTDPDSSIGEPMTSCHCLAAQTLNWLCPQSYPSVHRSNTRAYLEIDGEDVAVEIAPEVTAIANKFDKMPGKYAEQVTLSELEQYMPELFGSHNSTETR